MPTSRLGRRLAALSGVLRGGSAAERWRLLYAVVMKNLRGARLRRTVRRLHGPAAIPHTPGDVIALCCLRDGMTWLPHFLRHHRRLGVAHFAFLDNGSVDGTVEHLRAQPDVTLYSSLLPYGHYKNLFKRFIASTHGRDRWALLLDCDECFDFPGSDRITLRQFIAYLEEIGANAVAGHMLDLFPSRPILETPATPEDDLDAAHRHYQLTDITDEDYGIQFGTTNRLLDPGIRTFTGGVRRTFFGASDLLTKHPLFRWHGGMGLTNSAHDITGATVADVTIVLRHYKFTADFSRVLARAINEGGYYAGSRSYQHIAAILKERPDLSLVTPAARELRSADELVAAGFLRASDRYRVWVEARAGVSAAGGAATTP